MAEASKSEVKQGQGGTAIRHPAARFWAVDLHTHTPASKDVTKRQYGEAEASDVVEQAVKAGLDAIAITDHNTADWCDAVSAAASSTDLVVLPGVEITTSESHLLAVFEEGTPCDQINEVLVLLGFGAAKRGDLHAASSEGFLRSSEIISNAGGIAIPAHVDGPKGLLGLSVASTVRDCLEAQTIAAIEVLEPSKCAQIQAKIQDKRTLAFVRGSDSMVAGQDGHRLTGIGGRRTWIKASRPDLRGIRHAFQDPDLRVSLDEPAPRGHWYISKVAVRGGFLDGQTIDFSPDMTCMLGGTGTGKSLTLELIRFALAQQTPGVEFGQIRTEVDSRLDKALGADSSVELEVVMSDGSTRLIRRPFASYESPPPEMIGFEDDEDVGEVLPIRAFSQSEVIEYARQPVSRMVLIDGVIDIAKERAEEERLVSDLNENGSVLAALRQEASEAKSALEDHDTVKQRLSELKKVFQIDEVKDHEKWSHEKVAVESATSKIPTAKKLSIASVPKFELADGIETNADIINGIAAEVAKLEAAITSANESIDAVRTAVVAAIRTYVDTWKERKQHYDEKLAEKIAEIDEGNLGLLALRNTLDEVQDRKSMLDDTKRRLDKEVSPRITELLTERETLLNSLTRVRGDIRKKRSSRIDGLNQKMKPHVRIRLIEEDESDDFRRLIGAVAKQSSMKTTTLDAIAANASPIKLVESYLTGDARGVAQATGLDDAQIKLLFDHVDERDREEELFELQHCEIPDSLSVEFRQDEGEFTKIEQLSHGQKCTAILIIALAEGIEPLIIDQPEDALHAPWIEDHLVGRLRELRGTRQFLFATRSPGLVVSADAEMLITMRSKADKGEVEASGSLERFELNELALYHLEGGPVAFLRRYGKLESSIVQDR